MLTQKPSKRGLQFLWSRETLLRLLDHNSTEVRGWAAHSLLRLYPEAREEVLGCLRRVPSDIVFTLLDGLAELPQSPNDAEHLYNCLTRPDLTSRVRALAAVLLVRLGAPLPDYAPKPAELTDWLFRLRGTEGGAQFLLAWYRNSFPVDNAEQWLKALSEACGAGGEYHFLREIPDQKERRSFIKELEREWRCKLPDLWRVERFSDARGHLEAALAATRTSTHLEEVVPYQILRKELGTFRTRIEAILEGAQKGRPETEEEVDLLLACILALHRDAACEEALRSARSLLAGLEVLTLRPWESLEADPDVVALLQESPPDEVFSAIRVVLNRDPHYPTPIFILLESLGLPGWTSFILDGLEGRYGEVIEDLALVSIGFSGLEVYDALVERWKTQAPEPILLRQVAPFFPTEAIAAFLLEHFEEYARHPWSERFFHTLAEIPDRRFLGPLIKEWREGEIAIGRAVVLISDLYEIHQPEILRIREDFRRRIMPLESKNLEELLRESLDKPLSVPLRCTACGRTYHYDLERVFVPRKGDPMVGQIIQCKGCGRLETYEVTVPTRQAFTLEMARLNVLLSKQAEKKEEPPPTYLVPASKGILILAAGRKFRSISEAYHFLAEAVAQDPENAELHRRMANLLYNGGRPDLALPHYLEAVRLNPQDAEAVYKLVESLIEQDRPREAIPYVESLIRLVREAPMGEKLRRGLFEGLLWMTSEIEERTGHRIPLFPTTPPEKIPRGRPKEPVVLELFSLDLSKPEDFERAYRLFRFGEPPLRGERGAPLSEPPQMAPVRVRRKIGRNDPCPCGSGKKYKKCCGRGH